jgi:hypothetical protein
VPLFGRKRRDDPPSITLRDILLASMPLEKVATYSHSLTPWSHFAAAYQALRNGDHHAAIQHLQKVVHMGDSKRASICKRGTVCGSWASRPHLTWRGRSTASWWRSG